MTAPAPAIASLSPTAFRRRANVLCLTEACEVELAPADGGASVLVDAAEVGARPGRATLYRLTPEGREPLGWTEITAPPESRAAADPTQRWDALAVSLQAQLQASLARENALRAALDARTQEWVTLQGALAKVEGGKSDNFLTPETLAAAAPLVERLVDAWQGKRTDEAFAGFILSIEDEGLRESVLAAFNRWDASGRRAGGS